MRSGRERSCPKLDGVRSGRPMCDPEQDGVDPEQSGCDLVWSIALETENGIVVTRQETLVVLHMLRCNLHFLHARTGWSRLVGQTVNVLANLSRAKAKPMAAPTTRWMPWC
jgi:hypothetical protein